MRRRGSLRPAGYLVAALLATAALATVSTAQIIDGEPEVQVESPAEGDVVRGQVNVTGNASHSGLDDEVDRVEVRVDNGSWREANGTDPWNLTWDTTLWASGDHQITARAWDENDDANDTSAEATVNVTVNQAPNVTVERPREGRTVDGEVDVTGVADDREDGIERVEVQVDDGPWQEAVGTNRWTFNWNTSTVEDGNHTVTVRVHDGGPAPAATDQVNVTVSNARNDPPSLRVEEPEPDATLSGPVNVTGSAHDPEGDLQQVQVRVDDGPWETARGASSWFLRWNSSTVSEGDHTLAVRADDGETRTVEFVNVTVENAAGAGVNVTHPEPGTTVRGPVEVRGTVDAAEETIESVQVRVDDGPWRDADGTTNWTFEWNSTDVADGSHRIQVRAVTADGGNATASTVVQVANEGGSLETSAVGDGIGITIESPDEGEEVASEAPLEGTVDHPEDRSVSLSYRVDDGEWRSLDVGADGSFEETVDVGDLEPGPHEITVEALDDGGASETETVTIQVQGTLEAAPGPGPVLVVAVAAGAAVAATRTRRR